jgi:hypothetical protein
MTSEAGARGGRVGSKSEAQGGTAGNKTTRRKCSKIEQEVLTEIVKMVNTKNLNKN